jgi:prophage regulatory protein
MSAQLLRPRQAAKMLGVSRSTLYRLAADRTFPRPVKLTKQCVAWRESELREWVEIRQLLGVPASVTYHQGSAAESGLRGI